MATFGLPFAILFAVTFVGLNFFHNKVQEDVLREHKSLLDELRRDLDMLENFDATTLNGNKLKRILQSIFVKFLILQDLYLKLPQCFTLLAKIAALEVRMDNTAESLVNLCTFQESCTGGAANAGTDIECCVNANNNKLVCTSVFLAMTPNFNIQTNLDGGSIGTCDTRAYDVPPTTNICS